MAASLYNLDQVRGQIPVELGLTQNCLGLGLDIKDIFRG